ncbi:DUF1868 domain-containing protein [Legionella israelensis]|uniref:DUF1868 domain-containing protein n=1 Tax=Legionella israelensis TaxID=454 RepID=A0AAX1EF47_9GAMM|nr:DUF1868 domain-containing protein [Legionella israelensis]QBR83740.1 DUF1868 domain-containing protein [Legionella israelensis]QDP73078.1 DUF1868 domain-containing protein [Legionella israelensis]
MKHLKKIDSNGNYTKFPGVTIAASVQLSVMQENPWLEIYNALKKSTIISKYYALLPYQSYHMTTCNLYTEEDTPEWSEFITSNLEFFKALHESLKQNEFNPEVTIKMISTAGVLQLQLSLPQNQESIVQSIAKTFKLEDRMPYDFHITLAYEYRMMDNQTLYQSIKDELNEIIQPYLNKRIILNAPTLYYFENMTQFTPWDAKTNPFEVKKTSNASFLSLFTKPKTKKPVDELNSNECIIS